MSHEAMYLPGYFFIIFYIVAAVYCFNVRKQEIEEHKNDKDNCK
jgi:hypothetical protein